MFHVRVDPREVLGLLTEAEQKQLPFAVSLGLNRLANIAQADEREHMRQVFKLRRADYVLMGIKIAKADRATKTSWRVVISVAYPDQRTFMNEHERGDTRIPHGRFLWVPNPDVFRAKVITRDNPLHPKNLHIKLTEKGQWKGKERTFRVRSRSGKDVVLQREDRQFTVKSARRMKGMTLDNVAVGLGPHRRKERALHRTKGVRMLYRLVSRVRIPARLEFVSTISRSVDRNQSSVFQAAMADAMRTSR